MDAHVQQLKEELHLLRKVRTQCRSLQRDRGEISAKQQHDHDFITPHSRQHVFGETTLLCAVTLYVVRNTAVYVVCNTTAVLSKNTFFDKALLHSNSIKADMSLCSSYVHMYRI